MQVDTCMLSLDSVSIVGQTKTLMCIVMNSAAQKLLHSNSAAQIYF